MQQEPVIVTLDCETTTSNNGSPFDSTNRLCSIHLYDCNYGGIDSIGIEYDDTPYGDIWKIFVTSNEDVDLFIGFNFKFDLHWLRRYGFVLGNRQRVWDVQLAHYYITNQEVKFPSLNDVCEFYGLEPKLDIVKTEYWDKGLDTTDVPFDILCEYGEGDVLRTWQCYCKQQEYLENYPKLKTTIELACQDLIVLEEMEWNGLKYDIERSIEEGNRLQHRTNEINSALDSFVDGITLNWDSGDQLSAFLYGGRFSVDVKTPYEHTYKSGKKKGYTEVRYKHHEEVYELPRLCEPPKGSALKKEGYYATNQETLERLKLPAKYKMVVPLLLERAEIEKRRSTYYHGLPLLYKEMNWKDNIIHGQLNQAMTITTRLSSSKPNQQNLDGKILGCIISRY